MKNSLFCGKRKDNGEWVEGYYVKAACSQIEVDPATIEVQFIGIEQPDRTKEIYIFVFDFEINGVDYHYRQQLTSELFENFEYKKEKHGRWIDGAENFTCGNHNAECSACHCNVSWSGCDEDFNYCPNCGATMDGGA